MLVSRQPSAINVQTKRAGVETCSEETNEPSSRSFVLVDFDQYGLANFKGADREPANNPN
jgi:hypothetical protein